MSNAPKNSQTRLRRVLMEAGGLVGVLFLAVSFFDWLQDSLALG